MSKLHIIRASAFADSTLKNGIALLKSDDTVLLIDDGVYNLQHPILSTLSNALTKHNLLVIGEHVQARGLQYSSSIKASITEITIDDIIDLTLSVKQSITWQ